MRKDVLQKEEEEDLEKSVKRKERKERESVKQREREEDNLKIFC